MSYMAAHNKVRRLRGSASKQQCVECGGQAAEWAYTHDALNEVADAHGRRYSRDVNDYQPMCKHCHQVFDKSFITHCPRGHEYSGANLLMDAGKRKCRTCVYERNRRRRRAHPLTEAQKERRTEQQRLRRAQWRSQAAA